MNSQSSMHAYLDWAKERLDEIDATLASLQGKAASLQADARTKAETALAGMRTARDAFRMSIKEHAQANEEAFARSKAALELQWKAFEASVENYLDATGKQLKEHEALFRVQADAQRKAWQEVMDKLNKNAMGFAADRRRDIDTAMTRMKADAGTAKTKLDKLNAAGGESWAAMKSALEETRAAMDRASQAVHDAIKRAA